MPRQADLGGAAMHAVHGHAFTRFAGVPSRLDRPVRSVLCHISRAVFSFVSHRLLRSRVSRCFCASKRLLNAVTVRLPSVLKHLTCRSLS
jgi:hypothetical protein